MIVHGGKLSPNVRKVIVFLEEKGVRYESRDLMPLPKTPELLAMNPLGKIPILEHEDRFLPDSSVICAYIERCYPETALFPEDPVDYGRCLFLEEYADTQVMDVTGGVFFERVVKPKVMQQEADETRVADLLGNQLPPVCDYLDSQLGTGRETLFERFSVADAALGSQLASLQFVGEAIDPGRWPALAAYQEKLMARPSFGRAMPM